MTYQRNETPEPLASATTTTEAFEAPENPTDMRAELESRAAWMEGADLDDGSELLGDPDEYDEEDFVCDRCHGDGMDPWNDYLLECPECNGRSPL